MSDRTRIEAHRSLGIARPESRSGNRTAAAAVSEETNRAAGVEAREVGVHRISVEIALAAAVWFLLVTWLAFARGGHTDFLIAVIVLFFAFFFTLFLFMASYSAKDPRWPVRETNLREFLNSKIRIGSGTMSGRDVLIQTATIPVTLAFAATLIGLAWVIFG